MGQGRGMAVGLSHSPLCTSHGTEALGTLELVGKVHPSTELTLEFEGSTLLFGFCKVQKWLSGGETVTGSRQAQALPILPSCLWDVAPSGIHSKNERLCLCFHKARSPTGVVQSVCLMMAPAH